MNPLRKFFFALPWVVALWLAAGVAKASVGLAEIGPDGGRGPIAVFYPSSTPAAAIQRGPFTLDVALQGQPTRGNGRLVVVSHGSGGSPWPQADLARVLVEAGFVVAMPEHAGDNWHDESDVGPTSWKRRPREVSRSIDAVGADTRFAPLVALDRVGVYGMSAGGLAALTLAGARWSPAQLLRHCEAHIAEDFNGCAGATLLQRGDWLDAMKRAVVLQILRWRLDDDQWYQHRDARVQAVVAAVPMAAPIDPASLARPGIPVGLIQAGQDRWLVPRFHSGALRAECTRCEMLADLPTAGHGSVLSPVPPGLSEIAEALLGEAPGFDRAALPGVYRDVANFFRNHLTPLKETTP